MVGLLGGGFLDALQVRARMAMFLQLMLNPTDYAARSGRQHVHRVWDSTASASSCSLVQRAYAALIVFGYSIAAPITAAYLPHAESGFRSPPPHQLGDWRKAAASHCARAASAESAPISKALFSVNWPAAGRRRFRIIHDPIMATRLLRLRSVSR